MDQTPAHDETATNARPTPGAPGEGGVLKTTTNKSWLIKFAIFVFGGLVLAVWGVYDGVWLYPARGEQVARFQLQEYLDVLAQEGRLRPAEATVLDPASTLDDLRSGADMNAIENARELWLTALSRVRSLDRLGGDELDPEFDPASVEYITTMIPDPRGTREALAELLDGETKPKPLAAYDIPSQFAIAAVGLLVFVGVGWRIVQTMSTSYTYDPRAHRLTGPKFEATPEEVKALDKRKWHKFMVSVEFADDRPPHELDLYRFSPLEEWVLELERLSPHYEPEVEAGEPMLMVDVTTGVVEPETLEQDGPLVLSDDSGRPVRYPAYRSVAGEWYVVGREPREQLRAAIDSGQLASGQLQVDPETFVVDVTEVRELVAADEDDEGDESASDEQSAAPRAEA